MANRNTYRLAIQKEVDDTSTTNVSLINNIIADIYQELASELNPLIVGEQEETVAVTSGTVTPAEIYQTISGVHYKSASSTIWDKLDRITEKEYLKNHVNDTTGDPRVYLMRDDEIILTPPPTSGTLRIQGLRIVDELNDDTTTSIIPDRYSRAMILGCIARFLGYEKDPASVEYYQWYQIAKQDMLNQLQTRAEIILPSLY